jgi:hypothetical protein
METWKEMEARHRREKLELVTKLAKSRCTQTQAAKILDVKLTGLNNFIHRNEIFWPVIEQGKRQ